MQARMKLACVNRIHLKAPTHGHGWEDMVPRHMRHPQSCRPHGFPKESDRRDTELKMEATVFYHLISELTCHDFQHAMQEETTQGDG